MEDPQKTKRLKIFLVVLLVVLVVSNTALGILLISQNRESHPTVTVPIETRPAPAEPDTTIPPTVSPTETTAETTAPRTPTRPPTRPTRPSEPETQQAALVQLYKYQWEDNIAFYAANLIPGDAVTQYYCVRVTYWGNWNLHFQGKIRPGYERLAEVLKVRIRLPAENSTLYDGLLRDIPEELPYRLTTSQKVVSDLVYEITGYLDTSVDNSYQGQNLVADFSWWLDEEEVLLTPQPGGSNGNTNIPWWNDSYLPRTGDSSAITLWFVLACLSLLALLGLIFVLYIKQKRQLALLLMVLTLLTLCLSCLCVTGYAMGVFGDSVRGNRFQTGELIINLNDGEAVIDCNQDEMFARMEPGMTCTADFFVENKGTIPFLYKLYFDEIEGELADVLEVSVTTADGKRTLYDARPMREFTRLEVGRVREYLEAEGRQNLKLWIYFPQEAGNAWKEKTLTFRLRADAVQAEHNPNGEFE